MVEVDAELKARMLRFQNETGLTEEQIINTGDDRPPYPKGFETFLDEEGITLEEHRQEILNSSLDSLLTDESIQAIATLKEQVGFSTEQIAVILDKSFDEGRDILEVMTSSRNLRDLQLLTHVADVPTSRVVELLEGKDAESRYNEIEYGGLHSLLSEHFPNADWDKHSDVDTMQLPFDDPIIREIIGEPTTKASFTEQLIAEDDSKDTGKSR